MMNKREEWEAKVIEWWDANELDNYADDPDGESMWDAFEFIYELMKRGEDEE